MKDFRFNCPDCGQHLACDAGYAGYHIQCPGRGGSVVIPQTSIPAERPAIEPLPIPPTSSGQPQMATSIRFGCLNCGVLLTCGVSFIGHHIQCPSCEACMLVPRTLRLAETLQKAQPGTGISTPSSAPSALNQPAPRELPPDQRSRSEHPLVDGIVTVIRGLVTGLAAIVSAIIMAVGIIFAGCTVLVVGMGTGPLAIIVVPAVMIMGFLRWRLKD